MNRILLYGLILSNISMFTALVIHKNTEKPLQKRISEYRDIADQSLTVAKRWENSYLGCMDLHRERNQWHK